MGKGARYLDSAHLLFEESGRFSAVMKMFRHDPSTTLSSRSFGGVKEWTTRAPMLALSTPDPALRFPTGTTLQPKVFIRNASGKTFTAHLRFNWRSASTSGKSAPLDLAFKANETKLIDVAALQAQKFLPSDANWAAVILSAAILPDDLLAVAASYDQTGRYGTQTPFSDQLASHWEGGKWEVDGTHNSLVTIANGGNTPALAQLTIFYNQGSSQYQIEQTLAPDQQMALDFGKLIHDRVPDKNGNTLPPDLTSGAYRLRDLTEAPLGNLYEGKVVVDKTYGHAAYGCMICCGPNIPWMMYSPLSVLVNGFEDQQVEAGNSCTGRPGIITGDFPTWWTDNTSIATASGHQINGVAVGTTNHNALSNNMYWGPKTDNPDGCPLSQEQPSAPTDVTPTVAFLGTNNFIFEGSDPTVTPFNVQYVQGTPTGGTYTWSASTTSSYNPSISLNGSGSPYSTTASQVTVTANAPSSSSGDSTLTVNYVVNSTSAPTPATRAFTIRIFRFLQQSGNIQVIPINNSNPPQYGYTSYVYYNVLTNPGGQLLQSGYTNISVYETVSQPTSNFPVTEVTGTGGTNSSSQVVDTLSFYGDSPLPSNLSATADQYLGVGGFIVRHNTLSWSQTAPSITNLGPFN
jgi:hypothetical protein